ncbi:unnamed protein product [Closterium sp. Naga37s-1]|nr:unnamed protein product [Closterium sp. Naga37s-1]
MAQSFRPFPRRGGLPGELRRFRSSRTHGLLVLPVLAGGNGAETAVEGARAEGISLVERAAGEAGQGGGRKGRDAADTGGCRGGEGKTVLWCGGREGRVLAGGGGGMGEGRMENSDVGFCGLERESGWARGSHAGEKEAREEGGVWGEDRDYVDLVGEDEDEGDEDEEDEEEERGKWGHEKSYKCEECGTAFPTRKLNYHVATHSKQFVCPHDDCQKAFSFKNRLKEHILTHNPNTPRHPCSHRHCPRNFERRDDSFLLLYLFAFPPPIAPNHQHPCSYPYCAQTFKRRRDMFKHARKQHGGEKGMKAHEGVVGRHGGEKEADGDFVYGDDERKEEAREAEKKRGEEREGGRKGEERDTETRYSQEHELEGGRGWARGSNAGEKEAREGGGVWGEDRDYVDLVGEDEDEGDEDEERGKWGREKFYMCGSVERRLLHGSKVHPFSAAPLVPSLQYRPFTASRVFVDARKQQCGRRLGCQKAFAFSYLLKGHLLIHSSDASQHFVCPHDNCEKAFGFNYQLKRHLLVHNPNAPQVRCPRSPPSPSPHFPYSRFLLAPSLYPFLLLPSSHSLLVLLFFPRPFPYCNLLSHSVLFIRLFLLASPTGRSGEERDEEKRGGEERDEEEGLHLFPPRYGREKGSVGRAVRQLQGGFGTVGEGRGEEGTYPMREEEERRGEERDEEQGLVRNLLPAKRGGNDGGGKGGEEGAPQFLPVRGEGRIGEAVMLPFQGEDTVVGRGRAERGAGGGCGNGGGWWQPWGGAEGSAHGGGSGEGEASGGTGGGRGEVGAAGGNGGGHECETEVEEEEGCDVDGPVVKEEEVGEDGAWFEAPQSIRERIPV